MGFLKEDILRDKVVFFDVCGTLYESNTTLDFIEFCFKNSRSFRYKRFFIRSYGGRFMIKIYNSVFKKDFLRTYYVSLLAGLSCSELSEKVALFFDLLLENRKIEISWKLLADFQKRGYSVILVSASLDILIREVAKRMFSDAFYATHLEFDEDICRGSISGDLYGNKNLILSQFPIGQYLDSVFVTDNFNDINVRELVNNFVVISDKRDVKWWSRIIDNSDIHEK